MLIKKITNQLTKSTTEIFENCDGVSVSRGDGAPEVSFIHDGEIKVINIPPNTTVYICNNDGKTIEKVSV